MKECFKCKKIYDDSWGLCLNCNIPLLDKDLPEEEKLKIRENLKTEEVKPGIFQNQIERIKRGLKFVLRQDVLIKVFLIAGILFFSISTLKSCGIMGRSKQSSLRQGTTLRRK